jgi:hypothetical protein
MKPSWCTPLIEGFPMVSRAQQKVLWFERSQHNKQGVCHNVALPLTLKSILRQKKDYENSNILPCKNIILKKSSHKK